MDKNIIEFNRKSEHKEKTLSKNHNPSVDTSWVKEFLDERVAFYSNKRNMVDLLAENANNSILKHGFSPEDFSVLPDSVNGFINSSWREFDENNMVKDGISFYFDNGLEMYIAETILVKPYKNDEKFAIGSRFLCKSQNILYEFNDHAGTWVQVSSEKNKDTTNN